MTRFAELAPAAIDANGAFIWNQVDLPAIAPATPDPNPSLPLNPPSAGSVEYQRNYGLAAIHADAGYNLGATGKGITVAVIDTGFDRTNPDMQGAYSPDSVDIVDGRNTLLSFDRHGSGVAGVVASRFDGHDTVGVAYESTLLGIRADATAAGLKCDGGCRFNAADLAKAVDYATAKGAKVVNISLANYATDATQSAAFEAALTRATAAGLVFTVAASNSGEASPAPHALYAADSRYAGAFLAIGALAADGSLAEFSNRAGATKDSYLAAPGVDIVTDCNAAGSCDRASGTSFAAPHVAGALAMLLQYFPTLSGRDAVSILLRTADDKGDPGTDVVYGRGALNLTRAFQPVGAQSLSLADGQTITLARNTLGSALGSAFGDAVAINGDLTTVIHDDFKRPFVVDLAQGYAGRRRAGVLLGARPLVRDATQNLGLPTGAVLTLTAQTRCSRPLSRTLRQSAPSCALRIRPRPAPRCEWPPSADRSA